MWLDEDRFVTAIGPELWRFSLRDLEHPEVLGAHGVTLPHAIKRTPSGRYLVYGAMDVDHTYANQVGIFDLQTGTARVVSLPATAWHLGMHPTRDVCYVPTQRCIPQDGDFTEYAIAHFKNYLFEIDAAAGARDASPRDPQGHAGRADRATSSSPRTRSSTTAARPACSRASGSRTSRTCAGTDERPAPREQLRAWRAGVGNLVEILSRVNLPSATHWLVKAIRVAGGSALDGSYGLGLSPDRRFLLSARIAASTR